VSAADEPAAPGVCGPSIATISALASFQFARLKEPPMRYAEVLTQQTRRVISVDALRGFTFIWILGGDGAVWALSNTLHDKGPVLGTLGDFLGRELHHARWQGLTFYDFIFPLFIFITGIAIVLALPKLVEREGSRAAHLHVIRRALLLYGLGLIFYGGIENGWGDLRLLGVLQRIAICYLAAALLFLNVNVRALIATFVALLVGYWALMTFVPVPGIGAGNYAPDMNLANWIDAHYLPAHLWDGTRDPEGLLSTLPAIGTCLLGVFAGLILRDVRFKPQQKSIALVGGGIALVLAGHLWALQFPIVKAIWTSSFVLVAGGYSAILLGLAHQIVDVWGVKRGVTPLVWIGANAILLYMINGLVGFEPVAERIVGGDIMDVLDNHLADGAGLLLTNVAGLVLVLALARYLYRRQIFLRA
jgi:predicted acyltransferase